jgi:hypothetical protein
MDEDLRKKIVETPVGHLDGTPEQNVIPSGYDLIKDERTEFGFYWEYEDMEKCADKIMALIASYGRELQIDDREVLIGMFEANKDNISVGEIIATLKGQVEVLKEGK